jgi:CDGSH-type Zn-finger protein
MSEPTSPQNEPYVVEVEEGKIYHWCSCGKSNNQPFCDGSHQGSEFEPVAFTAEKSETVYLCGCKKTANQPFCDGSHSR